MKKKDVWRELKDKFKCDPKEYFELLEEPKRKPKFKYLGNSNGKSSGSSSPPSVLPSPGGGVLACDNNKYTGLNPMRVLEENERDDKPIVKATGTLTMFCCQDKQHYALTCFHVGRVNDGDRLALQNENVQDNSDQHSARTKTYWFAENTMENNNDAISFCDGRTNYVSLGDFHNHCIDVDCDILALKIPDKTAVHCEITNVTSPDWKSIWRELVQNTQSKKPSKVEKFGFTSAWTYGHIVSCHASYKGLFKNAIAVKASDDGAFLEEGDSGALVFYHDKNNMKHAFAYGVVEVDGLNLPDDDDEDQDEEDEDLDEEDEDLDEEDEDLDEEDEDLDEEDEDLDEEDEEDEEDEKVEEDADLERSDDESECGDEEEDDLDVIFREEPNIKGQYFLCFRLDTALRKLGLKEGACIHGCGEGC